MATIHNQIAYRVQNQFLDIATPDQTHDAIFRTVDTDRKPYCTLVPKQMPKDQLKALIPKKWYTAYEQLQTTEVPPLQYTDPQFTRSTSSRLSISYGGPSSSNKQPQCFPTQFSCVPTNDQPQEEVYDFTPRGETIYLLQPHDPDNPHCRCVSYTEQANPFSPRNHLRLSHAPLSPRSHKINTQRLFWQRYRAGVPGYDLLGEPSSKFDFVVYYGRGDPFADTNDYIPPTSWNDSCSSNDNSDEPPQPHSFGTQSQSCSSPQKKSQWKWIPKPKAQSLVSSLPFCIMFQPADFPPLEPVSDPV